ncbi:hypothetical protein PCANC_09560 [Puccinia coronata f. sp. avenae]|uniref:Uncharacterized protein n=1 Tax=Puccinia coronata f. sp. avenae TaxID=200324 RepID=A0A2N5U2F7_9BASI|nr:hypothetical protein PCASD_17811 [Puccinia coronata f. sp. avenae]PLW31888.1 hypothetical protein PCANC_22753 [Puccinia coronata f. sp. avenae]PLW38504.1 hypothetical protein PCASD_13763 [Puccinia coronata f. sp. avenae]PLW46746.1 hypothetical protein PCANC_09560 [Puccinia coronata f. sp. avenae]
MKIVISLAKPCLTFFICLKRTEDASNMVLPALTEGTQAKSTLRGSVEGGEV